MMRLVEVNREAPARRGHRFLALAAGVTLAAALVLPVSFLAPSANAASGLPQSSSKSSKSKSSSQSKKKKSHNRREPIQKAPTTDRIEEIQTALAREGYYHGDPTKKFDSGTQDALRRFQEEHGMTGTGKLDATTLQKLGLGSDIAGVSAPRQPVQRPASAPPTNAPPPATPSSTASTDPGN
jgi:peptidoglycan hydrolase-like protein with peptidoglycan-binding domain